MKKETLPALSYTARGVSTIFPKLVVASAATYKRNIYSLPQTYAWVSYRLSCTNLTSHFPTGQCDLKEIMDCGDTVRGVVILSIM